MIDINNLCMNCMSALDENGVCPKCGFDSNADFQVVSALPYKTILSERYLVGKAVAVTGEGITYIGYDLSQDIAVEICEFFPLRTVLRNKNGLSVMPLPEKEELFAVNLEEFLKDARRLAHMREISAISLIYDIFEENQTGYTVSQWSECITLKYFVERSGGNLHWNAARQIFMPILSAISSIHENSYGHFGISPSTLCIMPDGKMRIRGFQIRTTRRMDTGLYPDLAPGCAAIEQYSNNASLSEATDVYAFAATLFYALTGQLPADAEKRSVDARLMIPTAILKNIPPHVVTALANALQVEQEKRTQTFERLRAELSAAPTVTASIEETQSIKRIASSQPAVESSAKRREKTQKELPEFLYFVAPFALVVIILGIIIGIWANNNVFKKGEDIDTTQTSLPITLTTPESKNDDGLINVPNLVGQKYQDLASNHSEDFKLMLGSEEFSDEYDEGYIIHQTPAFENGNLMDKGEIIVVKVSKGTSFVELPYVSGYSLSGASTMLADLGLTPTKVDVNSDSVARGVVIGYENNFVGDKVSYGSQVVLKVSIGPKED